MISALVLSAVLAQAEPPANLVPSEPPPPPTEQAEERSSVPTQFYDQVLAWDPEARRAVKGPNREPLDRASFFREVGRVDLVDKSESIRIRRIILAVSAGAVLVAGTVTGIALFSTAGDLNSPYCTANVRNYNDVCMTHYKLHQTAGGATIAAALITSGLLATFAWWADPNVIDTDEATHLVSQYNVSLLKRVRAQPGSLRWMPVVTPDGAALALAGRF